MVFVGCNHHFDPHCLRRVPCTSSCSVSFSSKSVSSDTADFSHSCPSDFICDFSGFFHKTQAEWLSYFQHYQYDPDPHPVALLLSHPRNSCGRIRTGSFTSNWDLSHSSSVTANFPPPCHCEAAFAAVAISRYYVPKHLQ